MVGKAWCGAPWSMASQPAEEHRPELQEAVTFKRATSIGIGLLTGPHISEVL